jgi:hypothetical protein
LTTAIKAALLKNTIKRDTILFNIISAAMAEEGIMYELKIPVLRES